MRRYTVLILLVSTVVCPPLQAQVLRSAQNDPNEPGYQGIRPQITPELRATVKGMQALILELRQGDLDPARQQAALDELIRGNEFILRQHPTWLDWQQPQTVDSAALLLERMIFEAAAELAPTPESRVQVLENAPPELDLKADEAAVVETYDPPLLLPIVVTAKTAQNTQTQQVSSSTDKTTEPENPDKGAGDLNTGSTSIAAQSPGPTQDEAGGEDAVADVPGTAVKAAVLADDKATTDMHEDNAVLRGVTDADGQLVLFGKLRLWAGGAVQLDGYSGNDLYTLGSNDDSESGTNIRRAEGVLRASVLKNSELKIQYDFEADVFKNLYWRWLSRSSSRSVTLGNQKEPMGLDYLTGSKFATAMELSAPTSTFASYRSAGIRYNGWTTLESDDNPIQWWGDSSTYVTTSIGLFGEDLENTNDTDWAVTGRFTIGGLTSATGGFHLGVAASYRHGEYDRIAPLPGLYDANRIPLARPVADTLAVLSLEAAYLRGSLHAQSEWYYGDYDGDVDATGWGGYGQVGWLFGGKRRDYAPRWGTWSPIQAGKEQVFEVFARISVTGGNDDRNSSNELGLLTLGGNWYYRKFRVSANILLADTQRSIAGENDGNAVSLRLQYLF